MTDRSDTLSTNAATILAGMIAGGWTTDRLRAHGVATPPPDLGKPLVAIAVALATDIEAQVMARLRGEQDRRRANGGWDTPEQQDADDAHRRVERRRSNLPPPPPAFLAQPAIYLGPDRRGGGLGHGEAPTLKEKRTAERRKILQPDHVPNDPYDRRKTYDHPGNAARD